MKRLRVSLDALGMCASTMCMIHCLAFPLLVVGMPLWQLATAEAGLEVEDQITDQSAESTASSSPAAHHCEHDCCTTTAAGVTTTGGVQEDTALGSGCCSTPADYWFHVGMLATVAPLGLAAWGSGYRKHRRWEVLAVGLGGVSLLGSALLFGHHLFNGYGEPVMTVAGSMLMMTAHRVNRRECRCCRPSTPTLLVAASPPQLLDPEQSGAGA